MKDRKQAELILTITDNRIKDIKPKFKPGDPALKEVIADILVDEAEKLRAVGYMVGPTGSLIPCLPPGHPANSVQQNAQAVLARLARHVLTSDTIITP